MIIFISLIMLLSLGILLLCKGYDWGITVGMILTVFSGMFLIICLVSLITYPMEVKSDINKFLATEATIERARKTGINIVENAAIQHKIIESNQWLAQEQYYNTTIFEIWIPDEVDNLKPIK